MLYIIFFINLIFSLDLPNRNGAVNKCFPKLGCFSNKDAYFSVVYDFIPDPPENINTKFHLLNGTTKDPVIFDDDNVPELTLSTSKQLFLIVHDYFETIDSSWIKKTIEYYNIDKDNTFLLVDWQNSCTSFKYRAVANGRLVAVQIGYVLKAFKDAGFDKFFVIGLGIGAQVAAAASHSFNNITKSTFDTLIALHPDIEFYTHKFVEDRLDMTDAKLVVNVRSSISLVDSLYLRDDPVMKREHYLIQLNNPDSIIPCVDFENGIKTQIYCNEIYVSKVFEESLGSTCRTFQGDSFDNFVNGKYVKCKGNDAEDDAEDDDEDESCPTINSFLTKTQKIPKETVKLFSLTSYSSPYCGNHYFLQISYKQYITYLQLWTVKMAVSSYSFSTNFISLGLYFFSKSHDQSVILSSLTEELYSLNDDLDDDTELKIQELVEKKFIALQNGDQSEINAIDESIDNAKKQSKKVSHKMKIEFRSMLPQYVVFSGVKVTNMHNGEEFVYCGDKTWVLGYMSLELESNNKEKNDCIKSTFNLAFNK